MRNFIDTAKNLSSNILTEGEKLKVQPQGMGLKALYNDEIALAGGMRSGSSPGHYLRTMYAIFLMSDFENDLGKVEVWENQDGIHGLVNIEVDKGARRGGVASKVIKALVDNCDHHFGISDIRKEALHFWQSVGTRFFIGTKEITLEDAMKRGSCNGVIPKAGCNEPVDDYADINNTGWAKRMMAKREAQKNEEPIEEQMGWLDQKDAEQEMANNVRNRRQEDQRRELDRRQGDDRRKRIEKSVRDYHEQGERARKLKDDRRKNDSRRTGDWMAKFNKLRQQNPPKEKSPPKGSKQSQWMKRHDDAKKG